MRERRDQVLLGIAVQQAVFALRADERFVAVMTRGPQRIDDAPGFKIRARDVAHLAVAHQIVERTQCFVDRRAVIRPVDHVDVRSEEHTSELQSLMRTSYAVFCLQKKKKKLYYNSLNLNSQHQSKLLQ